MSATFRTYQLPWDMGQGQDQRFRKILQQAVIATLAFSFVMPWLPVPEQDPAEIEEVPQRFARLLLEKPTPPPPPAVQPQPKIEDKPLPEKAVEEVREPVPVPEVQEEVRERAVQAGLLPFAEELAALRDNEVLDNLSADQKLGTGGEAEKVERSIIASNAGQSSGGVNTAHMSRDTGGNGLEGRGTTKIMSPVAGLGAAGPKVRRGGAGPSRSREEIELVFEQNKGAIFALYNRALRRDPSLQGKLVLQITIAPSGQVTACEVVSSELDDKDMERKLVQRVKMFRFEAKDVAKITTTKPIDFFPA
ncbi:MAG: TonB family protein [Gammaproteobacteria bacterium]